MKRGVLATRVATAFLAVPGPVHAQDQMPEMTWFTVFTDHVEPANAMEYEAGIKGIVEAMTAAGVENMQFVAISGPELGYAYAVPDHGPDDHSSMMTDWQTGVGKVGPEKFMGIMAQVDAATTSREMYYLALRPDLSYKSETVGFDPAKPMRHYTILKVMPGKEMAMEAIAKKWMELYKANDVDRGWRVYQYMTGNDLPAYMVVESAQSEHDHHMMNEETNEMLGEAAMALFAETNTLLRGMENMTGWVRPDLSYPALEMTADGE